MSYGNAYVLRRRTGALAEVVIQPNALHAAYRRARRHPCGRGGHIGGQRVRHRNPTSSLAPWIGAAMVTEVARGGIWYFDIPPPNTTVFSVRVVLWPPRIALWGPLVLPYTMVVQLKALTCT